MSEFQKVSHPREFVNTQIFKRLTDKKHNLIKKIKKKR